MARFAYRLPAFATDFSAAISMISALGGMSVLHAPTGCMGDYCGFDEPDWIRSPGMTYCSAMKEDEAIFGNDEALLGKIDESCRRMEPPFVAIVGSPITALIGADLQGMADLSEDRTGVPTIAVDATGFGTYQDGLFKTFEACVDRFCDGPKGSGRDVGIVGLNKFDYHILDDGRRFEIELSARGSVGALPGSSIKDLASNAGGGTSYAVSYAGLMMARLLEKRFGAPVEVLGYGGEPAPDSGRRCLIMGDQVMSGYLRGMAESEFGHSCDVGTLFGFDKRLSEPGDFKAESERELKSRMESGDYDYIVCDPMIAALAPESARIVPIPHPAVSSKVHWNGFVPLHDALGAMKAVMGR